MFRDSSIGVVLFGKSGAILLTNGAFRRMVARSESGLANRPLVELIHPDDREYCLSELSLLSGGKARHATVDVRYLAGEEKSGWCRINFSLAALPDRSGKFIIGLVEEISRQKENEERIIASKAIAEQAFREAHEEREEAERARLASQNAAQTKSDFLANMSHEIRTPIHTVIGMSDLLAETRLDAEQQEYTAQIQFAADVLLGLVNDILDFSKIEAGKLVLESIDFDLYKMAGEAVDLVALEAHKKGVEVILFIENDVPQFVRGDPVRLRQIVINLFNNAVKFTHVGEIVVSIMKILETETSVKLHLFVKDTGVGIPADKRSRLFQVFSQVDSSTTRKYGGSGLGLSISKSLVELMQGEIGVESKEGVGSTFWFSIEFGKSSSMPSRAWEDPNLLAGKKALIVDDIASARIVASRYLEGWGCRVDQVDGGAEALEALRAAAASGTPYDLCLIDLLMPGMDGWQLASEINADKRINGAKLLLLSPAGKSGEEAKMKLLGWYDGYVSKPVKKGILFDAVRRVYRDKLDLESIEELAPLAAEEEPRALAEEEASSPEQPHSTLHAGRAHRVPVEGARPPVATGPREREPSVRPLVRLLVAEDHEVNRRLFQTILASLGFVVELAANGREAVEAVTARPAGYFGLIFMDVQMPEMNGYEAAATIREAGIDTPIIAVTASVTESEQQRCREAGMSDFLGKPFKKRDLAPVLAQWLGPASSGQSPGSEDGATDDSPAPANSRSSDGAAALSHIDPAVFDFREAVSTFVGKSEVVERMVHSFMEKVEGQLPKIRSAIAAGDFAAAKSEAHSIKGSGWNLQIRRVGDAAAKVESAASDGNPTVASAALERLEEAFAELKEAVVRPLPV